MNILITGGAGFIGANLVSRFYAEGHTLCVLDNLSPQIHGANPSQSPLRRQIEGKCEFVQGDVTDRAAVDAALTHCDAVVHLAAETGTGQSMYEVTRYCQNNVQGTAVLLEAIAARKGQFRKVVVASSRAVYGEGRYRLGGSHVYPLKRREEDLAAGRFDPICPRTGEVMQLVSTDEDSRIQPNSIYGVTKYTQEQMTLVNCRALGIAAVALRFQNVYGPGQSLSNPYTGILSIFSTRILHGQSIDIYEDGKESRDFVYIDDVVDSIVRSTLRDDVRDEVFGIGSGVPTSVLTVAQELCRQYGRKVSLRITGAYRVGDIRHNYAAPEKARELLGFEARTDFSTGIGQFARWVLTQPLAKDSYAESLDEMKRRGLYK
jgi:dTDP-L-rhamnose 4-epimerase